MKGAASQMRNMAKWSLDSRLGLIGSAMLTLLGVYLLVGGSLPSASASRTEDAAQVK